MRLYHGSDVTSVRSLLGGAELDSTIAAERHVNGAPGFYLATNAGDAEYFAIRRAPGAVVALEVDDEVVAALLGQGAVIRSIPRSPMSPTFAGGELYVPSTCFGAFNAARAAGGIGVHVL